MGRRSTNNQELVRLYFNEDGTKIIEYTCTHWTIYNEIMYSLANALEPIKEIQDLLKNDEGVTIGIDDYFDLTFNVDKCVEVECLELTPYP